jgi:hypothetical protein
MRFTIIPFAFLAAVIVILAGCQPEAPPPKTVSFAKEVFPILQANCQSCHLPPSGTGYSKSGLNMESYDTLMTGTKFGPIIIAKDSFTSALVMLIEGRADPSIRMPHGQAALAQKDIATIKTWIEQGALNN